MDGLVLVWAFNIYINIYLLWCLQRDFVYLCTRNTSFFVFLCVLEILVCFFVY